MMRKSTETLRRQWTLLMAMPASPRWLSTRELHQRLVDESFDVSIRTIQRDLDWLSGTFPLISEVRGKSHYWQWMKGSPGLEIPAMNRQTALVFRLTAQYLRSLMPGNVLKLLDPYFDRASEALQDTPLADWDERVIQIDPGMPMSSPEIDPKARDVVFEALLDGLRFKAEYARRYESESRTLEVNPLGIVTRDQVTYLVCTIWDYEDIRQIALHRISKVKLLAKEATAVEGFELMRYVTNDLAFSYPESPCQLKLKALFDEGAAFHLTERQISDDQVLQKTKSGLYRLTATVADTSTLRWWLLGFGDGAEVLGPKSLRNEISAMVERMAQMYR